MTAIVTSLVCARCETRLELAEVKVGICVHCEARELEATCEIHDREVDEELERIQEQLWQ